MLSFFKSHHSIKRKKWDSQAERFWFRHPHAAIFIMFMGLPILGLTAVFLLAVLVTLPMSFII